jgi:hypothetical protein
MTTERKILANRANAKLSTGPRSATGRQRSSQNARRHGLSCPESVNSQLTTQTQRLASTIAGRTNDPSVLAAAERLAETQIELGRIRAVKSSAASEVAKLAANCKTVDLSQQLDALLAVLVRINRYENRASARRRKAIKALDAARATQLTSRPIWQNEAKNFNGNKEAE